MFSSPNTKQFIKTSDTRLHSTFDMHKDNEEEVLRARMEQGQGLAALHDIVVPQELRPHDVITPMVL